MWPVRSGVAARVAGAVVVWLVTGAVILTGTANLEPDAAERPVDVLAYAVVSLACVVLGVVWRWPVIVAGVVTAVLLIYVGRGYPDGPVLLTGLVALSVLGTRRARRVAYGTAAGMAGLVVAASVATGGAGVVDLAFVGWAGAAVFAADALRARRDKARLRAEASEREERGRVVGERLRIAQDLHDSVGHAMAVINLQSGMAHHVIDRRPDLAKEALEVVRAVSEGIMEELNTMVRLLRDSDDGHSPLAPAPGIADLPAMMESTRQAGLDLTLDVAPAVAELDGLGMAQPVGVAVYRIVQESLTNVARHAGSARARVTVTYDDADGLRVEVADDGPATAGGRETAGSGVGITGMRERARATGGSLSAGHRPGGGFLVSAHWPAHVAGVAR